ncbi:uncharacterized protein A1O9_10178 [Exophiala aquamarina CBS 119918]|uniref:G domain-containing protein n=1 Tax=Exophiala aquamarina CBS 119918 TaxID=1182545 RepID=A0A072P289_9EURO|nr:uncharacterized protein A1O9_10178 [Exophiala aquamarina CBS 119918]KEF53777.1 hypothetical protein A1O9_10178 [Exophiala aquamarina CBS 119918]
MERLKTKVTSPFYEQQIKEIVKTICGTLENASDELFLYGFGRGAFIVRAVTGVLHTMQLPTRAAMKNFDVIYKAGIDCLKARREDDNLNGPKMLEFLSAHTTLFPRIRFVGVFDTIGYTAEGNMHDLSMVSSIDNMRHAIGINETRSQMNPILIDNPSPEEMRQSTLIQAWFIGGNQDLGGGSFEDGLSLYPLQWMILESMKAGLVLRFEEPKADGPPMPNPLALSFPHFAGDVPKFNGDEAIEWRISYTNDISISLYDLQSVHGLSTAAKDQAHGIRISHTSNLYNTQRKIFGSKTLINAKSAPLEGLIGWNDQGEKRSAYGTIIHPSVYCLLDRHPSLYEQARFKSLKAELSDFRDNCLRQEGETLPPWLEGMELQASGVKAFRILVCGKTGVGKSTLINKVFGLEMTDESTSYQQGVHDINKAFESPNHPGLLLHDSRGWQAGSDTELDLIAKFLRHRAFQKDPAQALHVIWFCVDSDVSRIEEADKRTFATIAQYSNHVPVFIIGTKKDKMVAYRKMKLLEQYMEKTNDFKESNRLATEEASQQADDQFMVLRDELSRLPHYKADGYCCLSKDDMNGIKSLLSQTLELISDDRVRLFCVAAQVVDVEQKIDSAITECMRLATHAVRTAMVPLPFSSAVGTPTVARILCEHMLLCFGFPKVMPDEVEAIMLKVLFGHLKTFMTVTMIEFVAVSAITTGLCVGTMGAGGVFALSLCALAAPPTARMLFKCAADLILILERSFRYKSKFVSIKQIEDAAIYYTTTKMTTFAGKEKLLQTHVHDEIDRMIPLKSVKIGFRFSRLREGLENIIYSNRFERTDPDMRDSMSIPELPSGNQVAELDAKPIVAELPGDQTQIAELPAEVSFPVRYSGGNPDTKSQTATSTTVVSDTPSWDDTSTLAHSMSDMGFRGMTSPTSTNSPVSPMTPSLEKQKSGGAFSRSMKAMGLRKFSSKNVLSKTKTG